MGSREMFEQMNRAIAQHALRSWIGARFAFEQARAAYELLSSRAHTGKVTIGWWVAACVEIPLRARGLWSVGFMAVCDVNGLVGSVRGAWSSKQPWPGEARSPVLLPPCYLRPDA